MVTLGLDVGAVAVASNGDPGDGGVLDRVDVLDRFQEKRRPCLLSGVFPLAGGAVSLLDESWCETTGLSWPLLLPLGTAFGADDTGGVEASC